MLSKTGRIRLSVSAMEYLSGIQRNYPPLAIASEISALAMQLSHGIFWHRKKSPARPDYRTIPAGAESAGSAVWSSRLRRIGYTVFTCWSGCPGYIQSCGTFFSAGNS